MLESSLIIIKNCPMNGLRLIVSQTSGRIAARVLDALFSRISSMRVLGLRLAGLLGLMLLVSACDKCGDPVHLNSPKIPNSCMDGQPAQK